jgi:cell division septum initiation protein DivIVA
MSVSFSRPDPTSPASVAEATFSTARKGLDPVEVREVLRAVATEIGRLQERERFLERELRTVQEAPPLLPTELDDETVTQMLGEETLRVLQTARESASQIKIKAEENAARIIREANDEANRMRSEAEVESARIRSDASADAEAELTSAKQQGREMVNEARAYRERVLSELARRRESARDQIGQLIEGRDRLLEVFERARLVAIDVVSDLTPIVEADDDIDLSFTTGPVPTTVPSTDEQEGNRDASVDDADAADADDSSADTEPSGDAESGDSESSNTNNVVSLFGSEAATRTDPRADVDDLFARLRAETEEAGTAPEAEAEAEAEAGAADEPTAEPEQATTPEPADEPATEAPAAELDEPVDEPGDESGDEPEDSIFTQRDAALVPLIVGAARKLKRVLADEQNDVLDTLRRKEVVTELAQIIPDLDEHAARYAAAIDKDLQEAFSAGASMLDDAGGAADGEATAARELLASGLVRPLRDRLERSIIDGSGDNDEVVRRVRAVYREWKTQHIDDQLDDVFRLAHGAGVLASVGAGTPLCWKVDPAGPACPDAEDNALAGVVPAGDAYPTGHVLAPAHAGCRCLLSRPGN